MELIKRWSDENVPCMKLSSQHYIRLHISFECPLRSQHVQLCIIECSCLCQTFSRRYPKCSLQKILCLRWCNSLIVQPFPTFLLSLSFIWYSETWNRNATPLNLRVDALTANWPAHRRSTTHVSNHNFLLRADQDLKTSTFEKLPWNSLNWDIKIQRLASRVKACKQFDSVPLSRRRKIRRTDTLDSLLCSRLLVISPRLFWRNQFFMLRWVCSTWLNSQSRNANQREKIWLTSERARKFASRQWSEFQFRLLAD